MSDFSITAQGHPALRATHGKTLELTAAATVSGRATCVVGVAARLPAEPLAGPLRCTLTVGEHSISFGALGNSAWRPATGSAVIRRSDRRLPDTLATGAELAAADLPRELVRALADPDAEVGLRIDRAAGPATVVRCWLPGISPARLRAEAAAADLVLAEDPAARSLLAEAGIEVRTGSPTDCLAGGGRVLAAVGDPAIGGTVIDGAAFGAGGPGLTGAALAAADLVEVLGLPAELAVSAAAADRTPVLLASTGVRSVDPAVAVVFGCPVERLAARLAELDRAGSELVVLPADDPERPVRGRLADLPAKLPTRGDVVCRASGQPSDDLPPVDPRAFVRALLAQSVTPRTAALALAGLAGWSRRTAYEFVLAQSEET